MVPTENLLAFALVALVLVVMPEPGVMFTIGRSMALGHLSEQDGGQPLRSRLRSYASFS